MFYSQFILAKKGPLGTIWIAAHLERKLRKNQVADTDIGVSVDSILFPEVPIALRLSSHLLLGVVRIYSRKVNYLFDDCSEALLKIKQAFRSTAVDLPPEESTAPYHSITLPETFDLDDFELPDSDMFQGNFVDHHVSTREQITLQDTMESVVYSTTQFGLDERFGDGETSGLDLDEELFSNKVIATGHAGVMLDSGAEPASVQPMVHLEQDKTDEGINGNSEVLLTTGRVNQLEGLAGNTDFIEYAQAPCTPGLMEEPNLSKVQEASACDDHLELGEESNLSNIQEASASDDHLESEDHNLIKFAAKENLTNMSSKSDLHCGNENAVSLSLPNDMNPVTVLGDQEINQLKSWEDSPSSAGNLLSAEPVEAITPVSEFPDENFTAFDKENEVEDLQKEVVSNNVPITQTIDVANADGIEPQGIRLGGTVSSPNFSDKAPVLEDPFGNSCTAIKNISEKSSLSSTCQTASECILQINQASLMPELSNSVENAGNMEKSCPSINAVASHTEAPSREDLENPETQALLDPKDSNILNHVVCEKMAAGDMHILQPCKQLNQPSMLNAGGDVSGSPHLPSGVTELCSLEISGRKVATHATEVQGEGFHADFMKPVLEENHTTDPASCEDIQADFSKVDDQVHSINSRDTELEKLDDSANSELPVPEKLLSVPEGLADLQDNLLMESTPDKTHLATGDGSDAGINNIAGKKRSFTESTMTLQSLNSVESLGMAHSKRTKESVPDDNDLLSSILVGRRSSVLKMKPTPPPAMTCMKRPRITPRVYASKRKLLMDDTMVLHGDVIRQQLTSTEDIRRIRKKAPCTHPEIWMIQKGFLEDEIFSEPIFTGLSTELALLNSQTYDLSEIRVTQNDVHDAFLETAADLILVSKKVENNPTEAANDMEFSMEPDVNQKTGKGGINESMVVRNNGEAESSENQLVEEHVLQSQGHDTQVQMEAIYDVLEAPSLISKHSKEIGEIEIDGASVCVADVLHLATSLGVESASSTHQCPVLGDENNISAGFMVPSASLDKESGGNDSLQMDASGVSTDQKLDIQSVEMDVSIVYLSSGKGIDAIKAAEENDDRAAVGGTESRAGDECLFEETEADMQIPCFAHTENENPSLVISPENDRFSNQVVVTIDQAMEEIREHNQGVVNEDVVLAEELDYHGKDLMSYGSSEEPKLASSYSPLNNVEYPGWQEAVPQCTIDADIATISHTGTEDCDDFDYTIDGHDTGFLNVDDDDAAEEDDHDVPSAEQTSFLENSGWSSRTRAVAKYLQVLFDKEAEHGRKVLSMDNLLVGKTRKEASRMFFEALVLKTRDYIHVEQGASFDDINIKPRVKLMKSDF
ncbi:sister chromatid cohesion 1 protein 4 isoform X1 [Camellia sinensis]|uniref:sister chromatid cohesion 1 protein 4 isoform X1 n=1 Tax=Camellia sinensis TaxID=4442 RepID=UPI0010361299|nr:sister chromatid cohesion 1 protein 4 isoform X1 [Camellia sinensis]XP_028120716.1 sister chromatid cohesion 1 protein 4 isoform X1 [Camellia sinensis]